MPLRGAPDTTGALRGFVPRSLGQRGSGGVRWSVRVGLALVDRRWWALGPNPSLWRIPGLRSLARRDRGADVYPRGAGGDGMVGSVRLVEGTGRGRGHRLALSNGRPLPGHEGPARAPGSRRSVGRPDRSAVGSPY